jgi:hypothetical protein
MPIAPVNPAVTKLAVAEKHIALATFRSVQARFTAKRAHHATRFRHRPPMRAHDAVAIAGGGR